MKVDHESYSTAAMVHAEGARIGLLTCLRCGASITMDPRDEFDSLEIHEAWHGTPGEVTCYPASSEVPSENN